MSGPKHWHRVVARWNRVGWALRFAPADVRFWVLWRLYRAWEADGEASYQRAAAQGLQRIAHDCWWGGAHRLAAKARRAAWGSL
jgi:hypothetical protein